MLRVGPLCLSPPPSLCPSLSLRSSLSRSLPDRLPRRVVPSVALCFPGHLHVSSLSPLVPPSRSPALATELLAAAAPVCSVCVAFWAPATASHSATGGNAPRSLARLPSVLLLQQPASRLRTGCYVLVLSALHHPPPSLLPSLRSSLSRTLAPCLPASSRRSLRCSLLPRFPPRLVPLSLGPSLPRPCTCN